ncbi:hypothetical protein A9Q99_06805 [Gammaproteobacteria bacterium 45_16_T64]|nr:hypothetical protein A9Q99_06805 [Gammaproteobacteria bacterium 45_16_T64]
MSLVLTIVRQPQGVELAQTRMTFDVAGGTIGRNAENNWQLPDPERFVSSRHASIRCEGNQFYLVDTSTNGVYHNNTDEALGTGNQVALTQGDRLYFGEYELTVDLEESPVADNMNLNDFDQWLDPKPASDFNIVDTAGGADLLSESEELDPLAALDKATSSVGVGSSGNGGIPDEDWLGSSQPDNALPIEQAFSLPPSVSDNDAPLAPLPVAPVEVAPEPVTPVSAQSIPDDWDIDDLLGGDDLDSASDMPILAAAPPPPAPVVKPTPAAPVVEPPPAVISAAPSAMTSDAEKGQILDEIESLLSADVELPGAQQDAQDVAQQETNELDAFLGLDDTPTPIAAAAPVAPPKEVVEKKAAPIPTPAKATIKSEKKASAPASVQPTNKASAGASSNTDELIEALGLDPAQVDDEQKANFNQLIADITVESTRGLMAVLGARNAIKNEFRMNVTLIQAAENNPLKFSPNVEEALKNMFTAQSNAYLPGVLAVRHGFQDIADHQIAVIAGMREAFNSMMKQFDPSNLSMRFDKQQSKGGLMKGKSAKYWESYAEFYKDLANNMEDAFQDLFGEDFAEAYEQQMNTLATARNKDR